MAISKIASFDPASYRNLGWAIFDITETEQKSVESVSVKAGTFLLPKVAQPWQMLWPLFMVIDQFFVDRAPDLIIIEKTSSFAGGFITGQVSNCIGVILASCVKNSIPVTFVYPTHVKKVLTGKGKATKSEMKKAVTTQLCEITGIDQKQLKLDSDHAYDAVANILVFLIDEGFLELE
jgi:Holliday junction resolvasome RuvABC endonuclease subunit